ncbi:hypothetical protein SAMN05428978_101260 [Nitrosomonas sp. Nm34]|nr:hypothetical protein SAMN05428978_101260 [Nitrosomonas sp. Nm34]
MDVIVILNHKSFDKYNFRYLRKPWRLTLFRVGSVDYKIVS